MFDATWLTWTAKMTIAPSVKITAQMFLTTSSPVAMHPISSTQAKSKSKQQTTTRITIASTQHDDVNTFNDEAQGSARANFREKDVGMLKVAWLPSSKRVCGVSSQDVCCFSSQD